MITITLKGKRVGNLIRMDLPKYGTISVQNTETWIYDIEDEAIFDGKTFIVEVNQSILDSLYNDIERSRTTPYVSIKNILNEGILGQPTGCRVNGGGCNRALVTTHKGTYIIGGNSVYTRIGFVEVSEEEHTKYNPAGTLISLWKEELLTDENDLEFCKKLDSGEGYNYVSYSGLSVMGCNMPQLYIKVQ